MEEAYIPYACTWHTYMHAGELHALELLMEGAGLKFGRAWSDYLEPCCVLRSKTAASAQWYRLKKLIQPSSALTTNGNDVDEALRKARVQLRAAREELMEWSCERRPIELDRSHVTLLEIRMVGR